MNQAIRVDEPIRRAAKKAVLDTAHVVKLPLGLLGFPELKEMEIVYSKAELPFMRLRQVKENNRLEFMIIEPNGLIDNYKIEISDQDLLFLGIEGPNDVLVLNIATIHNSMVTINLIGPIIVNRKTRLAKQVVIENHTQYSENHVLYQGEM